ncbi:ABC transporter permease [Ruminococcus sp.]|uniref:ABC transporter permease n=1 Tax=Ruminococcus sp. TaxID=41978 RepID=UPI0025E11D90|nr:ABC transporter permease [Ruminococcus sp.]
MNYSAIFKGRMRALFTDVSSLVILIIISVVSVYISIVSHRADSVIETPIAVVNYDKGIWGDELIKVLQYEEDYDFYVTDEEQARKAIARNKAHGLIIIKPDFSEKISQGEYKSLFSVTVMSDSYELNAFTEVLINDAIKIWMESVTEVKLEEIANASEDEIESFREDAMEIWGGESLLDIESIMVNYTSGETEEEENTYSGIRWYAALSLFYLIIGGTWMCDYGSGGLLKRAIGKGGNIALMYISQALPGLIVTTVMLIPVLIAEKSCGNPFFILLAYVLYMFGASGMALVVCSFSGHLSNLVLTAPVVTMAASLISGLLFKLPNWAKFWEIISVVFPGHWFVLAIEGNHFFLGAIIVGVAWFLVGMITAWLLGLIRKK